MAVVVLHAGKTATEKRSRALQGQDRRLQGPEKVVFIKDEEMPRTGTGKILHRILREQYGHWKDTM